MLRILYSIGTLLLLLSLTLSAAPIHDAAQNGDLEALLAILADDRESVNSADTAGSYPLHLAALHGHFEAVRSLIENGAAVSVGDRDNTTPLICAAMRGNMDIVSFLLDHGASISERDNYGNTPYLASAGGGNTDLVAYFLDQGVDVNQQDRQGRSALHQAAFRGRTTVIEQLVNRGANPYIKDNDSMSILCGAAYSGQANAATLLIELGADVNEAPNRHGHTPLFAAIWNNRVDVVRLLIEKGVDLRYQTPQEGTAMHLAAGRGHQDVCQVLLDAGIEVDIPDSHGGTPLLYAMWGQPEMVNWLLDRGAQVNALTDSSSAPIVNAIYSGNADIVRALISRGADVNGSGRQDQLPLQIAAVRGNEELCAILLEAGADVEVVDNYYARTPLHWAAIRGQSSLMRVLLDHGANVNAQDNTGKPPLYYACRHAHQPATELLLSRGAVQAAAEDIHPGKPVRDCALEAGEAGIWYLGHSGWGIKTKSHFLIFDYFEEEAKPDVPCLANGYIDPSEIKDLNVIVFSSHEHGDHYDTAIFNWCQVIPQVTYVLGHQPEDRDGYVYIAPRTDQMVGDLRVRTITSTDAGVGYLVNVDGLVILHAGDHANGVPGLNAAYTDEIDYLAGLGTTIDIAFLPITGCSLGTPESVKEGVYYALPKIEPRVFFPQHSGTASFRYREFADDAGETGYTVKIPCADNRGDCFLYKDGTIM
ncbi:MAG: ankyrin repeat domain-containing protein [Candidatus Zixiibacteriota bacterium]|nr:MAG: ankyrin repeat domain-containing protein [candidate division Zixibacteria bacterium]